MSHISYTLFSVAEFPKKFTIFKSIYFTKTMKK